MSKVITRDKTGAWEWTGVAANVIETLEKYEKGEEVARQPKGAYFALKKLFEEILAGARTNPPPKPVQMSALSMAINILEVGTVDEFVKEIQLYLGVAERLFAGEKVRMEENAPARKMCEFLRKLLKLGNRQSNGRASRCL